MTTSTITAIAGRLAWLGPQVAELGLAGEHGRQFLKAIREAHAARYAVGELYYQVIRVLASSDSSPLEEPPLDPDRRARWTLIRNAVELLLAHDAQG